MRGLDSFQERCIVFRSLFKNYHHNNAVPATVIRPNWRNNRFGKGNFREFFFYKTRSRISHFKKEIPGALGPDAVITTKPGRVLLQEALLC